MSITPRVFMITVAILIEKSMYRAARRSCMDMVLRYYDYYDVMLMMRGLWWMVHGQWFVLVDSVMRLRKYMDINGRRKLPPDTTRKRWTQKVTALPPIWHFRTQNTRVAVITAVAAVISR